MTLPRGSGSPLPIYLAVILIAYTASAGITTVYSMLSTFYREFDDPVAIGWVATSYWLVASVSVALCGKLGDALGRRRISIAMLVVAGLGSMISARADSLTGVILGCALQGTTGTLTPLSIGIVREALPPAKVPFAIGVIAAAGSTAAGVSFMVAGYFIDHYSWRGAFYMKAGLVALTILGLFAWVPASRASGASLPGRRALPGLLFAPAIAGIFAAIQFSRDRGWQDPLTLALLVASPLLLAAWARQQSRAAEPLIDVRSLASRPVLVANLCIGLLAMGAFQQGQMMSLLFQQPRWTGVGFELSATTAGLIMLLLNTTTMIGSPFGGALTGRRGARLVTGVGSALIICGWSLLAVQHDVLPLVLAINVMLMLGLSTVQASAYLAVVQATPPERTSEATGITYIFLNTCIAIGGQILFLLLASSTVAGRAQAAGTYPSDAGFGHAFAFLIAVSCLGLAAAFALPKSAGVTPSTLR